MEIASVIVKLADSAEPVSNGVAGRGWGARMLRSRRSRNGGEISEGELQAQAVRR